METAVCLSGQLRTLLTPAVQDSMISMVHQPANEYFISTEKWLDQHDPRLRISPVIAVYADSAGEDLHPDRTNGNKHGLKACRNHTMTHPYLFPQAVRWVACQRLLIREEQARRMQYTHVLRIRTDIRFVSPLPPAPEALALAGRDILLFDDMIALSAREHADALLTAQSAAILSCLPRRRGMDESVRSPSGSGRTERDHMAAVLPHESHRNV